MFRKFPLQLKTLKAKKPLPVMVLRGTPGKSSQPELAAVQPRVYGSAKWGHVHVLLILLKSVPFRIECKFQRINSRDGFCS